mmetsp:Transcript_120015/g.339594  ORF Transcript_120015/g.339594 Transcript_120015/m.339594 type:complete len:230 (-) Transcript_120015:2686-3375(-)
MLRDRALAVQGRQRDGVRHGLAGEDRAAQGGRRDRVRHGLASKARVGWQEPHCALSHRPRTSRGQVAGARQHRLGSAVRVRPTHRSHAARLQVFRRRRGLGHEGSRGSASSSAAFSVSDELPPRWVEAELHAVLRTRQPRARSPDCVAHAAAGNSQRLSLLDARQLRQLLESLLPEVYVAQRRQREAPSLLSGPPQSRREACSAEAADPGSHRMASAVQSLCQLVAMDV